MFSASGKVILLGEHAVVYGVPALACGLADGAIVDALPGTGRLVVDAWGCEVHRHGDDERSVARAYRTILSTLRAVDLHVDFHLRFTIPTGAGLGSSAAMAVALARAVAHQLGIAAGDPRVGAAAAASEIEVHGKPSGIDQAFAETGCAVGSFTRAGGLVPFERIKPFYLAIGHTGRARDTKGRVARVAELHAQAHEETTARFMAIAGLVEKAADALHEGALGIVGEAMNENQRHLAALEVSCPEIETLCSLAHDAGALGAKLTGGGGGGCVIALASTLSLAQPIAEAWAQRGFAAQIVSIGSVK